jgi:hypothetical protein
LIVIISALGPFLSPEVYLFARVVGFIEWVDNHEGPLFETADHLISDGLMFLPFEFLLELLFIVSFVQEWMRVGYRNGVLGWVEPLREEMEEPLEKLSRGLVLILLLELSRDHLQVVLKVHIGFILAVTLELLAQESVLVVLDVLLDPLVPLF